MAKKKRPNKDREAVDRFLETQGSAHSTSGRRKAQHPNGLEPGVRLNPKTGEGEAVVKVPAGQDPAWEELLGKMGFKDVLDVLEVIEVRAWGSEQNLQHYVKARVRRRDASGQKFDVEQLIKEIRRRKLQKPPKAAKEDRALVVALSDWQLGKADGDGIRGTVDRILNLGAAVERRAAVLEKAGKSIRRLVIACMGDLVEGCDANYPTQTFTVELNRREQCKIGRRLLVELIARWAHLAPEVIVLCVPGNHGEHRKNGKLFTTAGDNDDVAIVEQAADVCQANPDLRHISFIIPENDLTVTIDVFGKAMGFAHGHQAKSGAGIQKRLFGWWQRMAHSRHPIGDADILITGHYHHLQVVADGSRTWMQCPTLDGGSEWFEEQGGAASAPGTLTFTVSKDGWSDLEVL